MSNEVSISDVLLVHLGKQDAPVELVLLEQLSERLRASFREVIKDLGGDSNTHLRLLIRDAQKGSLILSVEPEIIGEDAPPANLVARTLIEDINSLAADSVRPTMSSNLLSHYKAVTEIGLRAGGLVIGYADSTAIVSEMNRIAIEAAFHEEPAPDTHVVGRIESVNIHRRPWTFGLYTKFDSQRVECRFPDEMLDKVLSLMDKRSTVEVVGEGRYGPAGVTPRQLDVLTEPQALSFDPDTLLSYRRSVDITRSAESPSDAVTRIREESASYG
jgi:hypothetical protein